MAANPPQSPHQPVSPLPEVPSFRTPSIHTLKAMLPKNLPKLPFPRKYLFAGLGALLVIIVITQIASAISSRPKKVPESSLTTTTTPEPPEGDIEFVTEGLGSSSPTPTPSTKDTTATPTPPKTTTRILLSEGDLDGFVTSQGTLDTVSSLKAGRNQEEVTRSFVSFDLTVLPTGITIQAAQLRLYQSNIVGTPYIASGELRVDHLNYGDSLDEADYALPAYVSNLTTASASKRLGWKESGVTSAVKEDILNARAMSQFRLHFSQETTGGEKSGDFALFTSGNAGSSVQRPQLVIEYY